MASVANKEDYFCLDVLVRSPNEELWKHLFASLVSLFKMTEWINNLCAFDLGICAYTFCCPTCAMASARTEYDSSNWMLNCCCLTPCAFRNIIREGYGIQGSCGLDVLLSLFLPHCTITQASMEVRSRPGPGKQLTTPESFSTGFTECGQDIGGLCLACCCFQASLAQSRSKYDNSNFLFNCCCVPPTILANIVREGYNLEGSVVTDVLCGMIPLISALHAARLAREVTMRGTPNTKLT